MRSFTRQAPIRWKKSNALIKSKQVLTGRDDDHDGDDCGSDDDDDDDDDDDGDDDDDDDDNDYNVMWWNVTWCDTISETETPYEERQQGSSER